MHYYSEEVGEIIVPLMRMSFPSQHPCSVPVRSPSLLESSHRKLRFSFFSLLWIFCSDAGQSLSILSCVLWAFECFFWVTLFWLCGCFASTPNSKRHSLSLPPPLSMQLLRLTAYLVLWFFFSPLIKMPLNILLSLLLNSFIKETKNPEKDLSFLSNAWYPR